MKEEGCFVKERRLLHDKNSPSIINKVRNNETINMTKEKRAIIVGASSGIGYEVARLLLQEGWRLGLAARRTETLEALRGEFQDQVVYAPIDVTQEESEERLLRLIDAVGGMDLYLHVAGVGWQNMDLLPEKELPTVSTNALSSIQTKIA